MTEGKSTRDIHHDPVAGETLPAFAADLTEDREPALARIEATGLEYRDAVLVSLFIRDGDPLSARAEMRHHARFRREGWSIGTRVAARMTADEKPFHIETEIEGFDGDERVFENRFRSEGPRDLN